MNPETTPIFLFTYFLVAFVLLMPMVFLGRYKKVGILLVAICAAGVAATIVIVSTTQSEVNFMRQIFQHISNLNRDAIAAMALGGAVAFPICLIWSRLDFKSALIPIGLSTIGLTGTLLFGSLITGKELISPYLPHPGSDLEVVGRLAPPEFLIEDLLDTSIIPVRIAVSPAGKVFVSGHLGIAAQEGGVVELVEAENGGVQERLVARMLNRPFGLLATDDHLYVSRSGQYTRWNDGIAEQISTGAVTQLSDLDNDGVMDHYHDIVKDLPGAKGPDFLHQNNGIAIGPDGALYITTANESDGYPSPDPIAGAILRASGDDFTNVETYATGLRNPFGLVFNSEGVLYATDNDSQTGLLGGNLGDKLLEVQEGAFYGHPYAPDEAPGVSKPLLRSSFALGGLAFADSTELPEAYRNSIFVVVYGSGRIMQVMDTDDGKIKLSPFATIPGAVDLAISPEGDFYVAVYPEKIVRIGLRDANQ